MRCWARRGRVRRGRVVAAQASGARVLGYARRTRRDGFDLFVRRRARPTCGRVGGGGRAARRLDRRSPARRRGLPRYGSK